MKISVIAIFYNSEKYMYKCIDSILSQKGVDLELIAVDDCSKDNTYEILQKYKQTDDRVVIIKHDENKGISCARNSGIIAMTGDCFYLIDGDDHLPQDALLTLSQHYTHDTDWVQGGYNIVNEQGDIVKKKNNKAGTYRSHAEIVDNFSSLEFIYTHNRLINKKFKHISFPIGKAHEDRFWNIQAFPVLNRIANVETATYNYVAHESSFSNKSRSSKMYIESALELLQEMDKAENCWKVESDTFLLTAIEKNIYIWKQRGKYRRFLLNQIRSRSQKVTIDIKGFPRFTKLVHKMIAKGLPDIVIFLIASMYRSYIRITKKPV